MVVADLAGAACGLVRSPVTILLQLRVACEKRHKLIERDVVDARCVVGDVTIEVAAYLVAQRVLVGVAVWRFDGRQFIVVRTQNSHQWMANHHHLGEVVKYAHCVVEPEVAEW